MEKAVLATGIYPPTIGGPATYVHALADELVRRGIRVTVVTYGEKTDDKGQKPEDRWPVIRVALGLPILRWWRYARALRRAAHDADIVYAFSLVSVGVPLRIAKLSRPKKILRLGGDFFWERYTGCGGRKTLAEWYAARPFSRFLTQWLLAPFDHIIFSSVFQQRIYRAHFSLPQCSVLENALPGGIAFVPHVARSPFRLLTLSRLVRCKNIGALVRAMALLPDDVLLTIVGDGPEKQRLRKIINALHLDGRVALTDSVRGAEKQELFHLHELLVLPSLTDITPNAALEAAMSGLPVLLTQETGLSKQLSHGIVLADLRSPEQIATAVRKCRRTYPQPDAQIPLRSWPQVCDEHMQLFQSLL